MLVFPNAKINLGLNIIEKRSDGFHNIETVFYPITWSESLEVISSEFVVRSLRFGVRSLGFGVRGSEKNDNNLDLNTHNQHSPNSELTTKSFNLTFSGLNIEGKTEDNLIYKAWKLINETYSLPPIKVHLHKVIPMGAGLGGGSSDAAFFIKLMDEKFSLNMSMQEKLMVAKKLGSDCAFFMENKAVYAKGKGDEFEPISIDLSSYKIAVVYPNIHSNTKDAYSGIHPAKPKHNIIDVITNYTIEEWKELLVNDFEKNIFLKYPRIAEIKKMLYNEGAVYASMSGSGSAVFGLFKQLPELKLKTGEVMWYD